MRSPSARHIAGAEQIVRWYLSPQHRDSPDDGCPSAALLDEIGRCADETKQALRGWVRQAEAEAGERDDRLTTAEHDELNPLRKEVAELRRANEILCGARASPWPVARSSGRWASWAWKA